MILAGARDRRREEDLRHLLDRFALLPFDPRADFHAASRIYRRCREVGVAPRGMVDCTIAAPGARARPF